MKSYAARVRAYEKQGMSTSDAQGVVDAEDLKVAPGDEVAERWKNAHLSAALAKAKEDATNRYAEHMLRRDQRERLEGRK